MIVVGIGLLLLIVAVYLWALENIWRVPFSALGVLVAGMAVHNFLVMLLIRLRVPSLLIRGIQSWKEGVLLVLGVLLLRRALRAVRERRISRLVPLDAVAVAFVGLTLVYLVVPRSVLPGRGDLRQELVSLRTMLLLPGLYLYGRVFWSDRRADLIWVARAILGAALMVGLFGFFELWFVPTRVWLDWGVNQFTAWLGFTYHGPGGLPENFFQSTGAGLALRRMVSTYISPLGIAYTGLLVVPLAAAVLGPWRLQGLPRGLRWIAFAILGISILLSLTRAAIACFVAEAVLLALLLRRRELVVSGIAVAIAAGLAVFAYPQVAPVVTFGLDDVRLPAGYTLVRDAWRAAAQIGLPGTARAPARRVSSTPSQPGSDLIGRTLSGQDPSVRGHIAALRAGFAYAMAHPLGSGIGSGVDRFGSTTAPGESALFSITDEIGILGGALYVALYTLAVIAGAYAFRRAPHDPLAAGFALIPFVGGLALVPIMLTSSVWGDFSVTFLFWWTAGMAANAWPGRPKVNPEPSSQPEAAGASEAAGNQR